MQIGIIGLPTCGKTTVFNALTHGHADTSLGGATDKDPNRGIAKVPDHRIDFLAQLYQPKKVTHATVEFSDVAGLTAGAGEKGFSARFLGNLRDMEALLIVVRVFKSESVPHPEGSVDPSRDLDTILTELILADLTIIEKRLHRIDESWNKQPQNRKEFEIEKLSLHRFQEALENDNPIIFVEPTHDEIDKYIRPYGLLSGKQMMVVANLSDTTDAQDSAWLQALEKTCEKWTFPVVIMNAQMEYDLFDFPPEEWGDYYSACGLEGPAASSVIQESYQILKLHSFLTSGKDEVRAWTIPIGMNAQKAAGKIHSDIERGFIRAEIMSFEELKKAGSEEALKKEGKLRLEGKEYIVKDGDIIEFRFNV